MNHEKELNKRIADFIPVLLEESGSEVKAREVINSWIDSLGWMENTPLEVKDNLKTTYIKVLLALEHYTKQNKDESNN